jgi:hypothetical protein
MITIPTDRNWTDEEIAAFGPVMENWTFGELGPLLIQGTQFVTNPLALQNFMRSHKVHKAKIKQILESTPVEVLMKKGLETQNKV